MAGRPKRSSIGHNVVVNPNINNINVFIVTANDLQSLGAAKLVGAIPRATESPVAEPPTTTRPGESSIPPENLPGEPIAAAKLLRDLSDNHGYSLKGLMTRFKKGKTTILDRLGLLKLPLTVQAMVEQKQLRPTVALKLLRLDNATAQERFAARAVKEKMTAKQLGGLIGKARRKKK